VRPGTPQAWGDTPNTGGGRPDSMGTGGARPSNASMGMGGQGGQGGGGMPPQVRPRTYRSPHHKIPSLEGQVRNIGGSGAHYIGVSQEPIIVGSGAHYGRDRSPLQCGQVPMTGASGAHHGRHRSPL